MFHPFLGTRTPTKKMSTTDQENPVSTQPSPNGHTEVYRRVSIVEGLHGHDNPAFDSPRSRKVSATSEHAETGPVRKKSILHNAHAAENISLSGGELQLCFWH